MREIINKQGNNDCIMQHEYVIINQHEYFIIGGCTTIHVLYSRIMPRVVLALDIAEVRKPALLLAIFEIE